VLLSSLKHRGPGPTVTFGQPCHTVGTDEYLADVSQGDLPCQCFVGGFGRRSCNPETSRSVSQFGHEIRVVRTDLGIGNWRCGKVVNSVVNRDERVRGRASIDGQALD